MKDDKKLREILQERIAIINNKLPKSAYREVENVMFEKFNVQSARVADIFNGFEPIESTPYHMLYKLSVSIKEVGAIREDFDYSDINIDTYFYEEEKPEYEKPIPKKDEDIDVEFDDWHETNVGMYSYIDIYTTVDYVYKLSNYNKLRFNPETQRDLTIIETNGIPIYKLDLNDEAIRNMKKEMLSGEYFPVQGALNINPELYNEYPIEIKNGKLRIDRKFKIDLVEGFHNYIAYTSVKSKNPDWKYPCSFRLYVMNTERANKFILQMNEKNHLKNAQTSRLDTSGVNYFIDTINTSSKFILHGTIDEDMRLYLHKIISNLFNIKETPEAAKLIQLSIPKLNYAIMDTDHLKIPFSKVEWFIYLYMINKLGDNFEKIYDLVDINMLLKEIKFKNEPLSKHYKLLDNTISEVKNNEL